MNKLQVKLQKNRYSDTQLPSILIDELKLDIWLDQLYPENNYLGLIPCIIDLIHTEPEQQLVLQRYNDKQEVVILPILMCPDDCDLWCTLIVAEVIIQSDEVWWNRIGLDQSDISKGCYYVGSTVEWFENIPQLKFEKQSYYHELNNIYLPIKS